MNTFKFLLVLLFAGAANAAQHSIGGDTIVNATNGNSFALTQRAAKTSQITYTATNNAIDFTQSAYVSNTAQALRFNLVNLPATATEDRCVITMVGTIGARFTNVADSITWLGPWGVLNAVTNTITVKWTGNALIAWQDPMHGVITPAQWVANTDNFDAGYADELRASSDAARNLTGIIGRPGGQYLAFENVGSFTITLKNSTTSTATNQFLLSADTLVGANQSITLAYDLTTQRWRTIGSVSASGGSITVATRNSETSVVTTTLSVPNGALTDDGGGTASLNYGPALLQSFGINGLQRAPSFWAGNASSTLGVFGDSAVTTAGTAAASAASSTQPQGVRYTTAGTGLNETNGIGGNPLYPANRLPLFFAGRFKLDETNANMGWLGFSSGSITTTTGSGGDVPNPVSSIALLRYRDGIGNGGWYLLTCDGTTVSSNACNVFPTASNVFSCSIFLTSSNCVATINGAAVATNTSNLPLSTSVLRTTMAGICREAAPTVKHFYIYDAVVLPK